jgi:thiamine-monophosphate kinase
LTERQPGSDISVGEFDLIERFFQRPTPADRHVALGIGDDCALLTAEPG